MALDAPTGHVGFPHSLNLLHSFVLANFVERSENFVKNVDDLILTLIYNVCKVANITEHNSDFSDVICHEIF